MAHLSYSQMAMYAKCPEQYRRAYIEKEKRPPGIALITGSCVHEAAEQNLRHKVAEGVLMEDEQVVDIARDAVERRWADEVDTGDLPEKVAKAEVIDMSTKLSAVHHKRIAPNLNPINEPGQDVGIEVGASIEIPGTDHDLIMYMDVVEKDFNGALIVRDLKTSIKMLSQADANDSMQLSTYSLGATLKYGLPVSRVAYDVLTKESEPRAQTVMSNRTEEDHDAIIKRAVVVSKSIGKGIFPPTDTSNWWCSEKWCGYAKTCPYFRGKRIF